MGEGGGGGGGGEEGGTIYCWGGEASHGGFGFAADGRAVSAEAPAVEAVSDLEAELKAGGGLGFGDVACGARPCSRSQRRPSTSQSTAHATDGMGNGRPGTSQSTAYTDRHADRYADRHADGHVDGYADRYADRYADGHVDRYADRYADPLSSRPPHGAYTARPSSHQQPRLRHQVPVSVRARPVSHQEARRQQASLPLDAARQPRPPKPRSPPSPAQPRQQGGGQQAAGSSTTLLAAALARHARASQEAGPG